MQRLVDAGAIPLGVTNTSELTLWIESQNPVYGITHNPYNPRHTAGGSSGGEGAAVGVRRLGISGSAADIGGSIRVPALFCGVFGHKPSTGADPQHGHVADHPAVKRHACSRRPADPPGRGSDRRCSRSWPAPDGTDPLADAMELGDPATVSLDGLPVTLVEGSSLRPIARELRDARERAAGALASAGAQVRYVSMPSWRKCDPAVPGRAPEHRATDSAHHRACSGRPGRPTPAWRRCSSARATTHCQRG